MKYTAQLGLTNWCSSREWVDIERVSVMLSLSYSDENWWNTQRNLDLHLAVRLREWVVIEHVSVMLLLSLFGWKLMKHTAQLGLTIWCSSERMSGYSMYRWVCCFSHKIINIKKCDFRFRTYRCSVNIVDVGVVELERRGPTATAIKADFNFMISDF
jgi:hypothetical protein